MEPLYPYYLRAIRTSRETFVAAYQDPFLLRAPSTEAELDAAAEPADDDDLPTQLVAIAPMGAPSADDASADEGTVATAPRATAREWMIAVVAKRTDGHAPFNRIFVGRSQTNDVVLNVPSVSKLHAQFHLVRQRVAHLADRRSANGTFHRDRRLEPDEVVELAPGDALRFGALELRFVDAAGLYDFLLEEPAFGATAAPEEEPDPTEVSAALERPADDPFEQE